MGLGRPPCLGSMAYTILVCMLSQNQLRVFHFQRKVPVRVGERNLLRHAMLHSRILQ